MAITRILAAGVTALLGLGAFPAPGYPATDSPPDAGPHQAVVVFALTKSAGELTEVATAGIAELTTPGASAPGAASRSTPAITGASMPGARGITTAAPAFTVTNATYFAGPSRAMGAPVGASAAASTGASAAANTGATTAATSDIAVLSPPMQVEPFMVAGLSWDGALAPGSKVFVRVLEGQAWSQWLPLEAEPDGPDGASLNGTEPFITGGATGIQIQITGTAAALPANVKLAVVPGNPATTITELSEPTTAPAQVPATDPVVPADVVNAAGTPTPTPTVQTASFSQPGIAPTAATASNHSYLQAVDAAAALPVAAPVPAPAIISRTQWQADPKLMTWPPVYAELKAAVIHHTAGTNNYTKEQSAAIVRAIYYYHSVTRDWGDIGYNFLVDKFGQIFEGRVNSLQAPNGSMVVGGHARPTNTYTMGISAMGTFYDGEQAPQIILDTMVKLISWKFSSGAVDMATASGIISPGTSTTPKGINLPRIYGHKDVAATACPGEIYPKLGWMIAQVKAQVPANKRPIGRLDEVVSGTDTVTVRGWVLDPDTTAPIPAWVTVAGTRTPLIANMPRPDVGAAFGKGDLHGFQAQVALPPGQQQVCVYMADTATGSQFTLECRTVIGNRDPIGRLDNVDLNGNVLTVDGWALDPDTKAAPINVHLYIAGQPVVVAANLSRPDVAAAFAMGDKHGFSYRTVLPAGPTQVCAYAINTPAGNNPTLGCRTVVPRPNSDPQGNLEEVSAFANQIRVKGWTLDRDLGEDANQVHIYLDGVPTVVTANKPRPDVDAVFKLGANHGFEVTVPAAPGLHQVCVYAINSPAGNNPTLGCKTVTTTVNQDPIGRLDEVSVNGRQITASGWALDPDLGEQAASVHVYIGSQGTAVTARQERADVGAAFGMGSHHGFTHAVTVAPGTYQVCAYAINAPAANNPTLGCRTVRVN